MFMNKRLQILKTIFIHHFSRTLLESNNKVVDNIAHRGGERAVFENTQQLGVLFSDRKAMTIAVRSDKALAGKTE